MLDAKDPDDRIDYRIDYSGNWRDSDEIESQSWFVESGDVTVDDMALSNDGQEAIVWLTDGEPGTVILTNRIQTVLGRRIDTSIRILVRNSHERPRG